MNKIHWLISISLILFFACTNHPKEVVEYTFYTQDSLYKITFDKPLELDTFYSWMDEDDNACSDEHKYRFSKSKFPIEKETGFFQLTYADSTYRLTIKHVEKYACKGDHDKLDSAIAYKKQFAFKCQVEGSPLDTIYAKDLNVNSQNFVLVGYRMKEFKNNYPSTYLRAFTLIDRDRIDFVANCRCSDCGDFLGRMEEVLKTIKIERVK